MTPDQAKRQRAMGEALMQQGASIEPVQHWTQALARVAQGGIGGYEGYQAGEAEKAGRGGFQQSMIKALEGGIDPSEAMTLANDPWAGEGAQNFLWKSLEQQESYRPATAQEKQMWGWDPDKPLIIDTKTGKPSPLNEGGGVTIDMGGKLDSEFGKVLAKSYGDVLEQADSATQTKAGIQQLRELTKKTPGGAVTGIGLIMAPYLPEGLLPKGADDATAAQAIISGMIPKQRVPGSGSTSDYDARQFAASVPSMWNRPGANAIIMDTMEAYADFRIAQADIITQVMSNPDITNKAGAIREGMKALPDPFARWKQMQAEQAKQGGGGGGGGGGGPDATVEVE